MSYKSSTGRNIGKLLNLFQSDKTILGQQIGGGGASAPSIKAITASGGTETTIVAKDGNNYKVHTFSTVGISTFTISSNDANATYYLQLQGGGAGGGGQRPDFEQPAGGGGGGGSGHLAFFTVKSSPGSYSVNVGYGGTAGGSDYYGYPAPLAGNGGQSSFTNPQITIRVNGGSGGGPAYVKAAGGGGAGGDLLTLTPQPSSTILYLGGASVPGQRALHGDQPQHTGQNGEGGNIWTSIHNNPANLFFASPNPVNGRGNGGPGQGPGAAGYARIYYQIPN